MAGADFILRLIEKVTGPSSKAAAGIEKLMSKFSDLGHKSEAAGGALERAMEFAAGTLIEKGIEKVADLGKEVAGTVIEYANFAQKSEFALGQLAKFGASPAKLFEHAQDLAVGLGMDVEQTTERFTEFLKLQMNPSQADDLIKMGADLRSLNTSAEQVNSVFLNMGQIFSKGHLMGDDLRSLEIAGISGKLIFAQLGKEMGKTTDEVQKLITAGKVDAPTAIKAIQEAVKHKVGETNLGEAGTNFANTMLEGIVGKMKAQGQVLLTRVGKALVPAFMSAIEPMSKDIGDFFGSSSGTEFVDALVEGFGTLAGVVRDAWPFVKTFVSSLIDGFQAAWPPMKAVLGTLFDGFGSGATWMDTVRDFAKLLGEIIVFGAGVAAVFGGMVAAGIQIAVGAVNLLIGAWNGLISGIGAVIFAVDDFIANLGARWERLKIDATAAGANLIQGLVDGINSGFGAIWEAAQALGTNIMTAIKQKLGIASPSKEFMWIGAMSGAGFVAGLRNAAPANDIGALPIAQSPSIIGANLMAASMPNGPIVSSMTAGASTQAIGGIGDGGGRGISPNVTISVTVHGDTSDGEKLGKTIGDAIEDKIGAYFERLAQEAAA